MNTRARVTTIPAILAAGALASIPVPKTVAAQGSATPQASPATVPAAWADLGLPELNFNLTAETVEGVPESIEAGRYLLSVTGEPASETSPGGVLILQLPEGTSMDDAMAEGAAAQDGPPAFFYEAVLPGGAEIGQSGTSISVIDLSPGEWIVSGSGLSTPPVVFTATGELPTDLPEPESNATLTLDEMTITVTDGELAAGENQLRIENIGDQPHFVTIDRVPDGTTAENVEATLQSMMGTPVEGAIDFADLVHVGGSADQSSGTTMWMPITLEAGTYVGLCFITDPETGMPHAMMGMHIIFSVA